MSSIIRATTTSGLQIAPDNSGSLQLQTNGTTTAVTIDTSQNVGIGTAPSTWNSIFKALQIGSGIGTAFLGGRTDSVNNCQLGLNAYYDTTDSRWEYVASSTATRYYQSEGTHVWDNAASGTANNAITWSERMRIDSSGSVLVNSTSAIRARVGQMQLKASSSQEALTTSSNDLSYSHWAARSADSGAGTHYLGYFENSSGTNVGTITHNNTNTSYTTSSDYRLKENIVPMTGALDKVLQLKPVNYTWKINGSNSQGFIAHELQAVVPDCVTGEKDAVDADGNPKYQGIDTSFLVATLTAAIQEQQTIINDLKARVEALEAKLG
jgi:hypothetical protein